MKRYFSIYLSFFKNSLIREMQFRAHFWLYIVINLIWVALAMLTFLFIFNNVNQVQGWTFPAMMLLTATFYFFDRVFNTFFEINFSRFNYLINHGDLDWILTKPVSAQFFISFRQMSLPNLMGAIAMLGAVTWLLKNYFSSISLINLIIYGLFLIIGLIIIYSLWFITLTLVFWLGNIENIHHLFRPIYEVVRIPIDITGFIVRPLFTYFLPLAFVATVPVKALIGQINYGLVIFGVVAALFWLFVSRLVWRLALKHYGSASS